MALSQDGEIGIKNGWVIYQSNGDTFVAGKNFFSATPPSLLNGELVFGSSDSSSNLSDELIYTDYNGNDHGIQLQSQSNSSVAQKRIKINNTNGRILVNTDGTTRYFKGENQDNSVTVFSETATGISTSQINIQWDHSRPTDPLETKWTLQRRVSGNTSWNTVFDTNSKTFNNGSYIHSDTGLSSDTTYEYRIRSELEQADGTYDSGPWSSTVSAGTGTASASINYFSTDLRADSNGCDGSVCDSETKSDSETNSTSPSDSDDVKVFVDIGSLTNGGTVEVRLDFLDGSGSQISSTSKEWNDPALANTTVSFTQNAPAGVEQIRIDRWCDAQSFQTTRDGCGSGGTCSSEDADILSPVTVDWPA